MKVRSELSVPGDGKWHHVAVTYDGSSKAAGVTFYVNGVKEGPARIVQDMLTADIGTLDPYCIGGRALKTEKEGPSAGGCGYNMVGDIDEVGVFSYVLQPGHAIAIYSLATGLKYTLEQTSDLIELHRAKKGSVKIGDKTWEHATSLKGALGKIAQDGQAMSIKLADDGTGVEAKQIIATGNVRAVVAVFVPTNRCMALGAASQAGRRRFGPACGRQVRSSALSRRSYTAKPDVTSTHYVSSTDVTPAYRRARS